MLHLLYWFTIKFGLIRSSEETKIYGAGIISSKGEVEYSLSNEPTKLDYDVAKILKIDCCLISQGHYSKKRLTNTGTRVLKNLEEIACFLKLTI